VSRRLVRRLGARVEVESGDATSGNSDFVPVSVILLAPGIVGIWCRFVRLRLSAGNL